MSLSKVFLIRFSELFLKKKNKSDFLNTLITNIKLALAGLVFKITTKHDHCLLEYAPAQEQELINILRKIPGIYDFCFCYLTTTNLNDLAIKANLLVQKYPSFKIEVKRKYKAFYEQTIIKQTIARYILTHNKIKVDVHKPAITISVIIQSETKSYVCGQKIAGVNGLPIGSSGKVLALLSGGIDSPVAAYLMQNKGLAVDYVHFNNSTQNQTAIVQLIKTITYNQKLYSAKLFWVDFHHIQQELSHTSLPKYKITLMRRSFYRLAAALAQTYGYLALVCGDSLGQVASQTLESIMVISAASNVPILRPLLTYHKLEIIHLAQKINTYEQSIKIDDDVCCAFAPKNPITKPKLALTQKLEIQLSLLKDLEAKTLNQISFVKI